MQQRRAQRLRRGAASVMMVALATASACSSGTTHSAATTTTSPSSLGGPTTTPDPNATVPPVAGTSVTNALKALLADPGPGFAPIAESSDGAGPVDLSRAADQSASSSKAQLAKAGFVGGYTGRWQHTDGRQLQVIIYQFADAAGAAAIQANATGNPGFQASPHFPVPNIAGAQGSISIGVAAVSFTKGPYLVSILGFASADAAAQSLATAVAEAQYTRLG